VLKDGRTVHVAARSAAVSEGRILLAGTPILTWAGAPTINDELVGVVIDADGGGTPVPNPHPGRTPSDLHVASARDGGWHIVFVESSAQSPLGPVDSGTVWYGRFDGDQWHGLTRAATVHHALLNAQFSSDLGVDGERLRFAFGFDKSAATGSSARGNQGVIMLRRDQGVWTLDTLHTPASPTYVQLARGHGGSWQAAIVRSYAGASGSGSSSLFLAAYDTAWAEPRLLVAGDAQPISEPSVIAVRNGLVTTWLRRATPVIEMAVAQPGVGAATISTVFASTADYSAVAIDSTVLWLTALSKDSVRAVLYRGGQSLPAGTIVVDHDSPLRLAVPVSPRDIVLFTSRVQRSPAESPAITIMSRVTIWCPPNL
jgi:hypothetical protein